MWQSWMWWKMPLIKWHTFWMAPCLVCYFIVISFYIDRNWLLMRNLATILPLKSKLYGKFQCFNAINGNIEMLQNSYEVQTVNHLKEIIQPYPFHILSDKISLHLWNKNFLREIYRNIQVSAFKKWCCANNFFGTKQKHVCSKTCKVRNIFVAFREHIIFNAKWVEVRNMTEVFWAKLYCKMSDFFC